MDHESRDLHESLSEVELVRSRALSLAWPAVEAGFGSRMRPAVSPVPDHAAFDLSQDSSASRDVHASQALFAKIQTLNEEIRELRLTKQAAEREVIESGILLREAEARLHKLRSTITFQLADALLQSGRSWQGALRFPREVLKIAREARVRRQAAAKARAVEISPKPAKQMKVVDDALRQLATSGPVAAAAWARSRGLRKELLARVLIELARSIRKSEPKQAAEIAVEAVKLDPSQHRVKWLAFVLADAGFVADPAKLLISALDAGVAFSPSEKRKAEVLLAITRVHERLPRIVARARQAPLRGRSLLLVSSQVLPFHWTHAARRTHATALAMRFRGWSPSVVCAPACTSKEEPRRGNKPFIGEIPYHDCSNVEVYPDIIDAYAEAAVAPLVQTCLRMSPTLIQCEWRPGLSLAALNAARSVGIPFVLDVGDITPEGSGRPEGWFGSEHCEMIRTLCGRVAAHADAVIARSSAIAESLLRQGVSGQTISLIPDAYAPSEDSGDASAPAQLLRGKDAPVIGFVGPITDDLKELVLAAADLVEAGEDLTLLLVGTGPAANALQALARQCALGDRLIMTRRPRDTLGSAWWRAMDIAAIPSPARPPRWLPAPFDMWQALAHGVPVVAALDPSIRALLASEERVVLVPPGNRAAFANALGDALKRPDRSHRPVATLPLAAEGIERIYRRLGVRPASP